MISLAFWATAINYLDRQTLSVAAPTLRAEFHMSNTGYSRVVFGFLLAYTIMNGVSGPLIDRLGTRFGYALCAAWWSAAAMLHATVSNALGLGACRFLLGMGEAGNWPAAVKVVAEWFPERERALAAGIFNSGASVGAIIAPPLVAWLLLQFGWRQAFFVVGLTGFVWLIFWIWLYRTPGLQPKELPPEPPLSFGRLIRTRFVIVFVIVKIFFDPIWYFYIFWFPEYLKNARGFDLAGIGRYAWIPFAAAGSGNFLGGWLSSSLLRRGYSVTIARKATLTVFGTMMMSAIPAVLVPQAWLAIALVSLAMTGYTGCNANMLAIPADVFPKNSAASVFGIASMGSGFGGMLFTLATGWLVDHYSYTPVFFIFGLLPLIFGGILWRYLGPITPLFQVTPE
jgi:ACS family hexuronate transporter-like MFS transporter